MFSIQDSDIYDRNVNKYISLYFFVATATDSQEKPKEQPKKEKPNLNDIILDLNLVSKVTSNLAISLAVYADMHGELDESKFKVVDEEQEQKEKQE